MLKICPYYKIFTTPLFQVDPSQTELLKTSIYVRCPQSYWNEWLSAINNACSARKPRGSSFCQFAAQVAFSGFGCVVLP